MLAVAGNKDDMYEHEEVEEKEGKDLAKELGAIFQKTSAKEARGIEDLFIGIGKKFLGPTGSEENKNDIKGDKKKIKLNKNQGEEKQKKRKRF